MIYAAYLSTLGVFFSLIISKLFMALMNEWYLVSSPSGLDEPRP